MPRIKKRNNYTLSIEAQEIIDKVKNKSRFVSEAIIVAAELINKHLEPIEDKNFIRGGYVPLKNTCEHDFELGTCVNCGFRH